MPRLAELNPSPSQLASSGKVGAHFGRTRQWGLQLLKEWYDDQRRGGIPRVVRKGRNYYTTMAVLYAHAPRGRDEHVHRRIRDLEVGLEQAFVRIAELEKRAGKRR